MKINSKRVIFVGVLTAILIIIILSITFASTGKAFFLKKTYPANLPKVAVTHPGEGCYLKINNAQAYWLTSDKKECESLFIALNYVGRTDFYRLLYSLEYPNAPVSKTGLSAINSGIPGKAEKVTLANTSNNITILYYSESDYDYFNSVKPKFSSSSCQELEFFGIKLYCFNAVAGKKGSNLPQIITYFTILKYTSNQKAMNGLVGEKVYPMNFIVNNKVKYFDASVPNLYGETLESVKCLSSQGSANYQLRNGESRVYICQKLLDKTVEAPQKLYQAAVLYHEANHKFQQGHDYDVNCTKTNGSNTGDKDFNSVYGAHINYLLSMAQNEILPCEWRKNAFDKAESETKIKLCQKPNAPKIGDTKPKC